MARHRRRPVPRHQARRSGGNSAAAQPPDRRLGSAMRRVVVTPTFAAGLGVVVAAVLAYPMRTVFNYAGPAGGTCPPASCEFGTGAKAPQLGSGNRMKTPGPSGAHSGTNGSTSAAGYGSRDPGGHGQAGEPQLTYHTFGKGQWGFEGTIEITFQAKHAHDRWRLRFGYPSARILKVWAGKYVKHGLHSAVVGSWDWPSSGGLVRVSIGVDGHPGPPHVCSFNGRPCHIVERPGSAAGGGAGTGGGGRGHQGRTGHRGGAGHGSGTGTGSGAGTRSGTGTEHKGGTGRKH